MQHQPGRTVRGGNFLGRCAGIALAAMLAAGCATVPPDQDAAMSRMPSGRSLDEVVVIIRGHAAREAGMPEADVRVTSAISVTWPDGSLGCPQPGMVYTQALVPGYRILVRAGDRDLQYHASRSGHFVLCPAGRGTDPVVSDDTR